LRPVRFTAHAWGKLSIIRRQGFSLDEEQVVGVIQRPQQTVSGYLGRIIAQAILDEEHVIRVVYEENDEIIVVTLYAGRRERYEG
jgi:hypothetical protein